MAVDRLLRAHASAGSGAVALFCGDRVLSYSELDATTDRLAAWFLSEGLQPGDRVAIQWPNAIEVVQVYFAAFKAGLIAVPINLRLKPSEIAWIMNDAAPSLCFAPPPLAAAMPQTTVRLLSGLPDIFSIDTPVELPEVSDDAPAIILYTSGSTGRPKGATLTHQALTATAELCFQAFAEALGDSARPRGLAMTPLMHASGLYSLLSTVRIGEPCALLPIFDPAAVLDALERHRCTLTLALPAMMQFVLEEQVRRPRNLSALRAIFAGGDSVPVALQQRVSDVIGVPIVEGLAQTETGLTIVNPIDHPKSGALGRACRGVELRIVDAAGQSVPDGEPGELLVRSPAMCSAYWNNPQATAEAFRDGWFHTGDLVSKDPEGYYWFRGRLKEIIIRGGSNISPQEVEEALYTHPTILEAAVVGLPHDVWGEMVVAGVVFRQGTSATEDDVRRHAREVLADYKVPERVHVFDALPKGPTGKVHRRAVRDMLLGNV
ncbi:MAG TPA: AMP-binding protein [Vicinamibacterales bacterium]